MPRIYTSDGDAVDLCRACFPKTEAQARATYGQRGPGPDGRGDCFSFCDEHPPYADEAYDCESCGRRLTRRDD